MLVSQPQFKRFHARLVAADHSQTDLLPGKVDKPQRLEFRDFKPGHTQSLASPRSGDSNCGQLVTDVRHLDVIHDDVLLKNSQDFLDLRLISINQQRLAPVVSVQIAQNMSLRIQRKSIHAMPMRQVTNVIRDHAVQPAHPVDATERNLCPGAEIVDPTPRNQRLEFRTHVAKISP